MKRSVEGVLAALIGMFIVVGVIKILPAPVKPAPVVPITELHRNLSRYLGRRVRTVGYAWFQGNLSISRRSCVFVWYLYEHSTPLNDQRNPPLLYVQQRNTDTVAFYPIGQSTPVRSFTGVVRLHNGMCYLDVPAS